MDRAFFDHLSRVARAAIAAELAAGLRADNKASGGYDPVTEADRAAERALREAIETAYPDHGIDPADLASIATAYDRAVERPDDADTASVIDVLGTAIGDHLVSAGGYRWVVSTDPFGTDLAVEPPRRGVPVVTTMLVAVRWMSRERGWVDGVVGHLVRIGRA